MCLVGAEYPILLAKTKERPPKRIRTEDTLERKSISNRAQLYAPFRALGLVTTHVPFVLQTKSYKGAADGPKVHILTCLGNSWALWDGGKMTLLFVGK
jgi:U3 small nucleolar RNA-associated protein 21